MAGLLLAGLLHPRAGLLFVMLLLFCILYYAPPRSLPSILLLVTVVITALALAIIGWLKAPKEVFNLSKPLVLSMTVLLVTSVLLGSRIGLSISGIAGAGELEELKKQMGVHRFWKYLASILLPRLSFFLLWLLLLGYAVKYLADLQL